MALSAYQHVIHQSKYARWNKRYGRRETLPETMGRYLLFMRRHLMDNHKFDLPDDDLIRISHALNGLDALPSMRALMAAGPMLEREHLTGYNCSYLPIDHPRAFDEALYLLMCTCGVGFSVERQFIGKLPMVPTKLRPDPNAHIVVPDTRIGWAQSLGKLLKFLWSGVIPTWSTHLVRPKGALLKTTGGTASGPEPLEHLFRCIVAKFQEARGRRLSSLDCHDIVCHIGNIVMVGDIRQAALISLSNPSDLRMKAAKSGDWYSQAPWRMMANNSSAYTETPTPGAFMDEWLALYNSKSGERGIFSRLAAIEKCNEIGRRTQWPDGEDIDFGANPCAEIILRPLEMCNLSEVVCRASDDAGALQTKVEIATILGTWQSTLTKFRHLRPKWRQNCEEERLLGVSMTGVMDCDLLNKSFSWLRDLLEHLRGHARKVNREWAEKLGIPASAAITTVKPSGTVSQLVGSASGLHARFAKHYLRRINLNRSNPMCRFLVASGFAHEPHHHKPNEILVFGFPQKAPEGAVIEGERSAIETLEHWRMFRNHWCDHNPSITVSVEEKEWPTVGGWVFDNFQSICGVSFFPKSGAVYEQMPFEAISKDKYQELYDALPDVDWEEAGEFERRTQVEPRNQEFACVGGACERV